MRITASLRAFRIPEITVKTGFILIGALLAIEKLNISDIPKLIGLFVISMISGLAIYGINAYFGYQPDQSNERLSNLSIYSKKTYKWLAIICTGLALGWMYIVAWDLFLLTVSVLVIWSLYVIPGVNLKGRPGGGVFVAFFGQIMHFHIGVFYFGNTNAELFYLSIYYALLFMCGHAWHEIIDWEADKKNGDTTTAIFLGKKRAVWFSESLFLISTLYLVINTYLGKASYQFAIPYILAFVAEVFLFIRFRLLRNNEREHVESFRKWYMLIYFIATLFVLYFLLDFNFQV